LEQEVFVKLVGVEGLKKAKIKFMGAIPELPGGEDEKLWLGVETEEPLGKHDGCLGEKRVFQCNENCGVFCMRKAVRSSENEDEEAEKEKTRSPRSSRRDKSKSRDRRRRDRSRSKSPAKKKKSGFGDTAGEDAESATAKVQKLLAGITQVERPEDEIVTAITDRFHPTRKQRRLYICNLPTGIGLSEEQVCAFFNIACREAGCNTMDGDSIIGAWLSEERTSEKQVRPDGGKYLYGFLEYRTVEETTRALALNGIMMQGLKVTVRRPSDYEPPRDQSGTALGQGQFKDMPAGPNAGLNMAVFGNNNNIPEGQMGQSAVGGWVPRNQAVPKEERPPSTALLLENMVTAEELADDDQYADIVLDTQEECQNYGPVKALEIPRPAPGAEVSGVGKVYVLFETKEACMAARDALHMRAFDGRTVFASFCDDSPGVVSYLFKL